MKTKSHNLIRKETTWRSAYNLISAFLFMSCTVICLSCGSDDDPAPAQAGTGTITAKIDGTNFSADVQFVTLLDNTLNLGIITTNNAQLQVTPATEGTHQISPSSQGVVDVVLLKLSNGTTISLSNGSITISKLTNNSASGTFQGTAVNIADFNDEYQITEGTFNGNF
ncbi:hypothetical protein QQ008_05975 [Fulvivirgaceae bacterium BMA10]|uniref:DUF4382 domain-containing protein n=1 Tax=Splendidivirga corallicola TaxID=3051826 RepID=A0ABT8KJL6_9BACT|nr:hypothetical protein [Fulvivirgaceae bacterium BMA10]